MHPAALKRFRPLAGAWLVAVVLTATPRPASGIIDLNTNGMSDVWELLYNATGVDPNADPDGDGVPNRLEAIAGTNPFDANSAPRITALAYSGTNVLVSIACALGKQYSLQSAPQVDGFSRTNWITETNQVARSGTVISLSAPAGVDPKFFRIAISDVDTDGDGVSDWEEYQLGLDPLNPNSNGQLDSNGQLLGDYAYATNKLALQNVVSIAATDPVANQPDPQQNAVNLGIFTVSRGGFPLNAVSVSLGLAAPGPGVATEGVDYFALPRTVLFPRGTSAQTISLDPRANTNLLTPATATLRVLPGSGYTVGSPNSASIVIYPSATPAGTGLTGQYFTNASTTYSSSANFNPANLLLTRVDTNIDFTWGTTTSPIPNNGWYSVRWTGQVQPQYSETYYFVANTDDGVKLWVNDQLIIDNWVLRSATDSIGQIDLQSGVRYDIKMEYFQATGSAVAHLSWYSFSQSKQVIPTNRLYPAPATAPSVITSTLNAYGFVNQFFSFTNTAANTPTLFTAAGLPPTLTLNPTSGLITGTPTNAAEYFITVTASNAAGLGASVLDLKVLDTGSSVVRELWLGVPGTNIADIPVNLPATLTNYLPTLEGITGYGSNYGERVRGYFTAPYTGNYYFWIAGSDAAELWISDDSEPCNRTRRAVVSPAAPTGPRQWTVQTGQRSGWLSLTAGKPYYLEVLHKAGVSTNDNWSVAWVADPTGTNYTPTGVVPGYLLSRYFPLPPSAIPGTLFSANMLAEGNASPGVGSATLRVSANGSQAVLKFSVSGLLGGITAMHIDSDPYLANPSQLVFDISAAAPLPDGSYLWQIKPIGTLSAADVLEIINEGKAYIEIQTTAFGNGEVSGHFTLANGTQTFTPPPAPPAWTDDHASSNAAARFLIQATFGPSPGDIATVQALGYDGWINNQFSLPPKHHLPVVYANASSDPTSVYSSSTTFNAWWQQSVTAPDQLRQRVAFALSEIMVVSQNGILMNNATALSSYYDMLLDNAFGNFRALLEAFTLHPAMGLYLDMRGNDKGSLITGIHANENYAREIQQLFTIGLYRLWPDGTLVLNSQGSIVPTYDQNVIMGFASVFTGWNYYQANQANGRLPANWSPSANYINPMVLVPTHHELGTKRLLDNVLLPQAWGDQANSSSTNFDMYCSQDLESALDSIFNHPNVGPFVCRQLIQRLITSNPSRDYLYRVVQAFNDNGAGVRGDLQAVLRAILLDYEARSPALIGQPTFGKQREPLLRATATARAFPPPMTFGGAYSQNGSAVVTVTCTNAHRLNNSDTVFLTFTDASSPAPQPAPPNQAYGVTVTGPTTFTFNAPGLMTGTYAQTPNVTISNAVVGAMVTTNVIFLSGFSGHGLASGNSVYLAFPTGGALGGVYFVIASTNSSTFAVATADTFALSGSALLSKISGGGYTQSRTNVTLSLPLAHGLNPGDSVYVNFTAAGSPADGVYQVQTVPDPTHFTIVVALSANQTQNSQVVYPLIPPPLVRAGAVGVQQSTWNVGATDTGSTYNLAQSPLNSPTVFNFYYPDYKFPGLLASAGLTTPEFQLTSDTSVALQMNFLQSGLLSDGNNTNGLTSFINHNGAVVLDLGAYMTQAYTANATALGSLFDALNTLLTGGQLTVAARTIIVNYVSNTANFPYGAPPSYSQMRDRVQAVAHLVVTSPDFTIQR